MKMESLTDKEKARSIGSFLYWSNREIKESRQIPVPMDLYIVTLLVRRKYQLLHLQQIKLTGIIDAKEKRDQMTLNNPNEFV
jgi:hypothetical protein